MTYVILEDPGSEKPMLYLFQSLKAAELFIEQFEDSDVGVEIAEPLEGEAALVTILDQDQFFSQS